MYLHGRAACCWLLIDGFPSPHPQPQANVAGLLVGPAARSAWADAVIPGTQDAHGSSRPAMRLCPQPEGGRGEGDLTPSSAMDDETETGPSNGASPDADGEQRNHMQSLIDQTNVGWQDMQTFMEGLVVVRERAWVDWLALQQQHEQQQQHVEPGEQQEAFRAMQFLQQDGIAMRQSMDGAWFGHMHWLQAELLALARGGNLGQEPPQQQAPQPPHLVARVQGVGL